MLDLLSFKTTGFRILWCPIILVALSGCDLLFGDLCETNDDCRGDTPICDERGVCVAGEAPVDSGPVTAADGGASNEDAGMSMADAGIPPPDAGAEFNDGGSQPTDSGPVDNDAGGTPWDGGMQPLDSGTPIMDGGTSDLDGGMTPSDGGLPGTDAGVFDGGIIIMPDGGTPTDAGVDLDAGVPSDSGSPDAGLPCFSDGGIICENLTPDCFPDPALRSFFQGSGLFGDFKSGFQVSLSIVNQDQTGGLAVEDLTGLQCFGELQSIYLQYQNISDLTPLEDLDELVHLYMNDNAISSVESLTYMDALKFVDLANNNIQDLIPLYALTGSGRMLQYLDLTGNALTSIQGIEALPSLTSLYLSDNIDLNDISPVQSLTALSDISLAGTAVDDLRPIVENDGIGMADVVNVANLGPTCNNAIFTEDIRALKERGVYVTTSSPCENTHFSLIPGGYKFYRGSDDPAHTAEFPRHVVDITQSFHLQNHEVTYQEWKLAYGEHENQHLSECETCPLNQVSWWGAAAFANWLSERYGLEKCYSWTNCTDGTMVVADTEGESILSCEGNQPIFSGPGCTGYRLPTEAEWEYAAHLRYQNPSDHFIAQTGSTPTGVDTYTEHPLVLEGMVGNLSEWVTDAYVTYSGEDVQNPINHGATDDARIQKGCHLDSSAENCRVSLRTSAAADTKTNLTGFRLARTATNQEFPDAGYPITDNPADGGSALIEDQWHLPEVVQITSPEDRSAFSFMNPWFDMHFNAQGLKGKEARAMREGDQEGCCGYASITDHIQHDLIIEPLWNIPEGITEEVMVVAGSASDSVDVHMCTPTLTEQFFGDLSSTWETYGSGIVSSGDLRLTGNGTTPEVGAVFYVERPLAAGDLALQFDFYLTPGDGSGATGEGLAISFINAPEKSVLDSIMAYAVPVSNPDTVNLGYGSQDYGNVSALHVEVDTLAMGNEEAKPMNVDDDDHIAVMQDGDHTSPVDGGLAWFSESFEDGIEASVNYTLMLFIEGSRIRVNIRHPDESFGTGVNLIDTTIEGFSFPGGYIGFSAGNHAAHPQQHNVGALFVEENCQYPE